MIFEKIFDPELKYDDFEEIRQELLKDYGKETMLEKMLKRAPDRLLSARMDEYEKEKKDYPHEADNPYLKRGQTL